MIQKPTRLYLRSGAASTTNACRCKASSPPSSSRETLERERLQQSQAQFNAALTASCFADREAFLSALLDEASIRQLEQQKQTLENQLQQTTALSVQASQQLQAHQAQRPEGLETDAATLQAQLHQLAQQLRDNTTHQGGDPPAAQTGRR